MVEFIKIHEMVNSKTGRTFKEDNLALKHNIPVGELVEIVPTGDPLEDDGSEYIGVRLHVIYHGRDCDGTPLYWLGIKGFSYTSDGRGYNVFGGFSEEGLRLVSNE